MTPTDAPTADRPISRGRRLLRVPAVLLGVGWFLVVPVLGVRALLWTMTFFGEQPTPADRAGQHDQASVALGVSVAIIVVGLVLSVLARSSAGVLFALLVLPTLLLGLLWLGTVPAPSPHAPGTSRAPAGACQEYSGGGTRCPGG